MNAPVLSPRCIYFKDSEFSAVCSWPFADDYVARLLASDIPQRMSWGGRGWVYCDSNDEIVGFGSMDLCTEYGYLTDNRIHPYIPLLAVHPDRQGRGIGKAILHHLVSEAVITTCHKRNDAFRAIFLDVYTTNAAAIHLYTKADFSIVGDGFDDKEGKPFHVMARSVAVSA